MIYLNSIEASVRDINFENLNSCLERIPFKLLKPLLDYIGIPTAKGGLINLKNSVNDYFKLDSRDAKVQILLRYYFEHIIYANKILRIYPSNSLDLINIVKSRNLNDKYGLNYNVAYALNDLKNINKNETHLWRVVEEENAVHLIFTKVRSIREMHELDRNIDERNFFDEIIGIKNIYHQCFDVVTVHEDGFIDIKIDYFKNVHSKRKINTKEFDDQLKILKNIFVKVIFPADSDDFKWPKAIDFKLLIGNLAQDKDLIIYDIAQTDNQGNLIKFSKFSPQCHDVREGRVFLTGNQALIDAGDSPKNHVLKSKIKCSVEDKFNYEAELILEEPPTIHNDPLAQVNNAIIKQNLGAIDYNLIRKKLIL